MKIKIEIATTDSVWKKQQSVNKNIMIQVVHNVLDRFTNLRTINTVEVSILLTDASTISRLNRKFCGNAKITNVLSFPEMQLDWRRILEFKPDANYMYLGDIAFCYQKIKDEALAQSKLFFQHFMHLFVHSVLHLIGFDHQNETEAAVMENLETKILQDFAIPYPY